MIIWHENFSHGDKINQGLIEKYQDDFFLKGDPPHNDHGLHYTGYHLNPHSAWKIRNGSELGGGYLDRELLSLYVPKLKSILEIIGLNTEFEQVHKDKKSIFSFQHIWGQLYKTGLECKIDVHNHFTSAGDLLSWVHFVQVPDKKLFFFQLGDKKVYPETQNSGDLIVYPSYAPHGVDVMTEGDEPRFVVVGNIHRIK